MRLGAHGFVELLFRNDRPEPEHCHCGIRDHIWNVDGNFQPRDARKIFKMNLQAASLEAGTAAIPYIGKLKCSGWIMSFQIVQEISHRAETHIQDFHLLVPSAKHYNTGCTNCTFDETQALKPPISFQMIVRVCYVSQALPYSQHLSQPAAFYFIFWHWLFSTNYKCSSCFMVPGLCTANNGGY